MIVLNQNAPAAKDSYRGHGRRPAEHSLKAQANRKPIASGHNVPTLIALDGPVSLVVPSLAGCGERSFSHHSFSSEELDRIWMLLHYLHERFVTRSKTFGDFTPVSSRALEAFMGREAYAWAKEVLKEARVIEIDETGVRFGYTGSRSAGWRFHPSVVEHGFTTRSLSLAASKRYMAKRQSCAVKAASGSPEAALILANLGRLTISPEYVKDVPPFEGMVADFMKGRKPRRKMGKKAKKTLYALRRKQAAWQLAIDFATSGRPPYFTQSKKSGRIYNSFTSFPKVLRGYALLDGQRTVEIDIKNSQPLLLANFYPPGSVEGAKYKALVESGKLYEHLMNVAGIAVTEEARNKFKTGIYSQVFFGENRDVFDVLRVWRKAFPELGRIIWDYKKPTEGTLATKEARKEASKGLAVELQLREAEIMIKAVIPRLQKLLPGVPVLPVHDSLVIPEQHAEIARAVIAEEVKTATGLTPKLRTTHSSVGC